MQLFRLPLPLIREALDHSLTCASLFHPLTLLTKNTGGGRGHGGRSGCAPGRSRRNVRIGQLEERVDLSAETDAKISQAESLIGASHDNLREALALLAALEKRCRVGNDALSLVRVCETSLQLCRDCGDDEALVATLKNLSTRRSQKTKAVSALVQKAMPWVMDGDGFSPIAVANDEEKAARERLVVALRDITDGKIFLEAERARLTRALATIKVRLKCSVTCSVF